MEKIDNEIKKLIQEAKDLEEEIFRKIDKIQKNMKKLSESYNN